LNSRLWISSTGYESDEFAEAAAIADAADAAGASNAASAGGTDHANQERTDSGELLALQQERSAFHRLARSVLKTWLWHWQLMETPCKGSLNLQSVHVTVAVALTRRPLLRVSTHTHESNG